MKSQLILLTYSKQDSFLNDFLEKIENQNISQVIVAKGDSVPSAVQKDQGVILCFDRMNSNVKEFIERFEEYGVSPLCIEKVNLSLYQNKDDIIAAITVLAGKLASSTLLGKAKRSILPKPGSKIDRRSLLKLGALSANIRELPIIKEACLAREGCKICVEACPVVAISVDNGNLEVSSAACTECGLCSTVCPSDYIQIPTVTDPQAMSLMHSMLLPEREESKFILTCDIGMNLLNDVEKGSIPRGIIPIRIPCIAALNYDAFFYGADHRTNFALVCPGETCVSRKAAEKYSGTILKIAQNAGIPNHNLPPVLLTTEEQFTDSLKSVRHYERRPHTVEEEWGDGKWITMARRLESLLGKSAASIEGTLLPFFDLNFVEEKCNMCEACATQCPVSALKIEKSTTNVSLDFYHSRCIGCMECQKVCPTAAIKVERKANFELLNKSKTLKNDEPIMCKRCGSVVGAKSLVSHVQGLLETSNDHLALDMIYYCDDCKTIMMMERFRKWV